MGKIFMGNRLVLDFNNFSEMNLYDVSILVSGFTSTLDAIPSLHKEDKFLIPLSSRSTFNYGFNIAWGSDFYFRVRLKGWYYSRLPFWPKQKYEQVIWYSAVVQQAKGDSVTYLFFTTHKDKIDRLETKFRVALEEDAKHIDRRFQN